VLVHLRRQLVQRQRARRVAPDLHRLGSCSARDAGGGSAGRSRGGGRRGRAACGTPRCPGPAPPGLPQLLALLCSGTRDGAAVGFQARERPFTMVRSVSS
jgi:hypothetical protein